jgi:Tol biopolymer transport system component
VSVSADGSTIASRRRTNLANLWTAEMTEGRKVRQMTFNSNAEHSISDFDVAEDGSVLFSADQLFVIGSGGGEAKQVTASRARHLALAYLPDGGMVFVRVGEDGLAHLWRADGDGNNAKQLTTGAGESFFGIPPGGRISPDGRTVLYRRIDRFDELWALPVGGGKPVQLADSYSSGADFSPDGSRISYQDFEPGHQSRFFWRVIEAATGKPIMTVILPEQAVDFSWTPDGTALTFLGHPEGARNVLQQPADGGKPEELTHFTTGLITQHRWAQDGSRLVLARWIEDHENLWMAWRDGSHPVQLTDFETGKIFDVKLARDGHSAIFTYGYESQDVVLIRNFR